jgi:acyl-CoA dehydrogenase
MDSSLRPDPDLLTSVGEYFAASFSPAAVAAGEDPAGPQFTQRWDSTARLGLPLVGIPEERGGSGGTLQDLLAVLVTMGGNAVPLPLAETSLAAWLLAASGLRIGLAPATIVPGDARDTLTLSDGYISGTAHDIPWARSAALVAALITDQRGRSMVVSFEPSAGRITPGTDLAGQPRDTVELSHVSAAVAPAAVGAAELFWRGALLRAAQMAGAIGAVDQITRRYTRERVQFGKPIAAFQAVQQHVVAIAQAAEVSTIAVWAAGRAAATRDGSFEACTAKTLANESARTAVRSAHQAHGAIGMTQEYPLHRYTRRLTAWRQEFGTQAQLTAGLGAAVAAAGSFARAISDHDNGIEVRVPCPT